MSEVPLQGEMKDSLTALGRGSRSASIVFTLVFRYCKRKSEIFQSSYIF